jgi:putative cell wall-binding protein
MRTSTSCKSFAKVKKAAVSLLCSFAMVATLTPAVALASANGSATKDSGLTAGCSTLTTSAATNEVVDINVTLNGKVGDQVPDGAQITVALTNATAAKATSDAANFDYTINKEAGTVLVSYYGLSGAEGKDIKTFDENGSFTVATIEIIANEVGTASASVNATYPNSVVTLKGDTTDYTVAQGTSASYTVAEAEASVTRLWGDTSMQTSVAITQATYDQSASAIIATATSYYDALAASAYAGLLKCPIMLVYSDDSYNDDVYKELESLGVKDVYVAGGEAAVSAEIYNKLAQSYNVTRVDGSSLEGYEGYAIDTALDFANRVLKLTDSEDAILVTQRSFMDALSMSSYAYSTGTPIIMLDWDLTLGARAKAILDDVNGTIYVAGGTAAVPEASAENVYGEQIVRLAGDTGYDTSLAIAEYMLENNKADASKVLVAAGTASLNGVDALAGSALAGSGKAGVILLAGWDQESFDYYDAITKFMDTNKDQVTDAYILGGPAALVTDYYNYVADYLKCEHEGDLS